MSELLQQNINFARDGLTYYMKWLKQYNINNNDAIWLFSSLNEETICFFKYMEPFKQQKEYQHIHIILPEGIAHPMLNSLTEPCHFVSRLQADAVIKLYALYQFSTRLLICDFDLPEGRMGHRLLSPEIGCTLDEIISIGILGLKEPLC